MDRYFDITRFDKPLLDIYTHLKHKVIAENKERLITAIFSVQDDKKPTLAKLRYLCSKSRYSLCEILHKWTKIKEGVGTVNMFSDFDATLKSYY
jgi:hypothetical protein